MRHVALGILLCAALAGGVALVGCSSTNPATTSSASTAQASAPTVLASATTTTSAGSSTTTAPSTTTASSALSTTTTQEQTTTTSEPTTTTTVAPSPITKKEIQRLLARAWHKSAADIKVDAYANFGVWSGAAVWDPNGDAFMYEEYFKWSKGSWTLFWDMSVPMTGSPGFRNARLADPPKSIPQKVVKWVQSHAYYGE